MSGTQHQFDTLESAQEFVSLLAEAVADAKRELEGDMQREQGSSCRADALKISLYNLAKLELHVSRSSRILNDLRSLRRLLFEERGVSPVQSPRPTKAVATAEKTIAA